MNPERWLAVLGIIVAVLAICVPLTATLMLRRSDRKQAVIDRQAETIERLKEANLNYRLALVQLGQTAESVNKTLSALPIPQVMDGGDGV